MDHRISQELQKLEAASLDARLIDATTIEVSFGTLTLQFVLGPNYPYDHPEAFFKGPAPDHPFYNFDLDDAGRARRTTNLANTNFGIYYRFHTPSVWLVDYIERIQESLTPAGAWMAEFMSTQDLDPK
jgi:hypothetical protein